MGVEELLQGIQKVPAKRAQSKWDEVKTRVGKVTASEDEGLNSVKAYFALKRFVEEHGLSGLATECYPNLMGQVCLAHALLGEEGIVAACEGDINSAVVMLMLYELTGRPVHNTDLLAVNEQGGSAIFSHCGSGSFCLAERKSDIVLGPVRLAHRGVCVLFPSRRGEVTLVNLVGGRETYRMCVVSGRASTTKMVFPGNPIRVKMPVGIGKFLGTIAKSGFGHHWMMGYGHVEQELKYFCKVTGVEGTFISK
jgi:L-fucose isomerase-like protein